MAIVPRLGIQRSLIAPGVIPQAPQSSPGRIEALNRLLGAATSTAASAAQFAAVRETMREIRDDEAILESAAKGEGIPKQLLTVSRHNAVWRNEAAKVLETLDPRTLERNPGETDAVVMRRWRRNHTPAGAPDAYIAALREGTRRRFSAFVVNNVRTAQRKLTSDMGENLGRAAYNQGVEATREAAAAWKPVADAAGIPQAVQDSRILDGLTRAANEGRHEYVKEMIGLLPENMRTGLVNRAIDAFHLQNYNDALRWIPEAAKAGKSMKSIREQIEAGTQSKDAVGKWSGGHALALMNIAQGHTAKKSEEDLWEGYLYGNLKNKKKFDAHVLAEEKLENIPAKKAAALTAEGQKARRSSEKRDIVRSVLSGKTDVILPRGLGNDLLAVQHKNGTILGVTNPSGTSTEYFEPTPGRFEQWAKDYAEAGMIPAKAAVGAETYITSNDPKHAETGIFSAMNLDAFAPEVAESFYAALTPEAQMRVSEARSRINKFAFVAMTPEQRRAVVSSIMPDILEQELSDMTQADAATALFPDGAPDESLLNLIDAAFPAIDIREGEAIPFDMVKRYRDVATNVYKANINRTNPVIASTMAHEAGMKDALNFARPLLWRGSIRYIIGAPPFTPDSGNRMYDELVHRRGAEQAKLDAESYTPSWSRKHDGIVLRSLLIPVGEVLKYSRDGRPVVFVYKGGTSIANVPRPRHTRSLGAEGNIPGLETVNRAAFQEIAHDIDDPDFFRRQHIRNTIPISDPDVQVVIGRARLGDTEARGWLLNNGFTAETWE